MNILSSNMHYAFSFFKESLSMITVKQKQIVYVVSLALGLLTAYYFVSRRYIKAKNLSDEEYPKLKKIGLELNNSPAKTPLKTPPLNREVTSKARSESEHTKTVSTDRESISTLNNSDLSFKTPANKKISFKLASSEKVKIEILKSLKVNVLSDPTGIIKGIDRDLDELNLLGCSNLADKDILELPPNLKKLSIIGGKKLTDKAIENLPRTLVDFKIEGCTLITNKAIAHLPPDLIKFSVRASDLDGQAIKLLSETLKKLADLSLIGFQNIDDTAMSDLSQNIKTLNITRCSISGEAFKALPRGLESLTLKDCYSCFKGEGFNDLPPGLQILNLKGDYQLSDEVRKLLGDVRLTIEPQTPARR